MTDDLDEKNKSALSRLDKHLHIMGIENASTSANAQSFDDEKDLIDSMSLPPLSLPTSESDRSKVHLIDKRRKNKKTPKFALGSIGFAAAAALFIFVTNEPKEDTSPYTVKGASKTTLYVALDGKTLPFEPGFELKTGTKVMVEILSPKPGQSFVFVVNGENDQRLLDLESVYRNRLTLKPNLKTTTDGSLELYGPSENETLFVVTCSSTEFSLAQFTTKIAPNILTPKKLPESCLVERFILRK